MADGREDPEAALARATREFMDPLRKCLAEELISQKKIAFLLGVQTNTVNTWLNKGTPPKLADGSATQGLHDLEKACGVPDDTYVQLYRAIAIARADSRSVSRRSGITVSAGPSAHSAVPVNGGGAGPDDRYLGVSRVHSSFPAAEFAREVGRAARVRIVNTWLPNLVVLTPALEGALRAGCEVEMLLLHPYSAAATGRDGLQSR